MKKLLYFILLLVEAFIGLMLIISLWNALFYVPSAVSAIVVGLLIWQLVWYFRTNDPTTRRKILRNIALIMLLPIAVFCVTYVVIAIIFVIAFA